jgi:hypothetical protein
LSIILVTSANWHESLYAKALVGPLTGRVADPAFTDKGFTEIVSTIDVALGVFGQWEIQLIIVFSLIMLTFRGLGRLLRAVIVILLVVFLGYLMEQISWAKFGLDLLGGYQFSYAFYALFTVTFVVLAYANSRPSGTEVLQSRLSLSWLSKPAIPALVFSLAVGNLAWYKAYTISNWLSFGGLSQINQAQEFAENFRHTVGNTRVSSVVYRLPAGLMSAAGLDTIDGFINLRLKRQADYWHKGVLRERFTEIGQSLLKSPGWDMKCCSSYELDKFVDIDFLRIANVGYIFSKLPLQSINPSLISGPTAVEPPPRNSDPILSRLGRYGRLNFKPAPILVYRLANPIPRVFAAKGVVRTGDALSAEDFLQRVKKYALEHYAVVRAGSAPSGIQKANLSLKILKYRLIRDGIAIQVEAPQGGIVVVNIPYVSYWNAEVDGAKATVFSANQIHLAIDVKPGGKTILLRYKRPLLRDKIFSSKSR